VFDIIIAISGLTGSGKDTLGKLLAKALAIRHLNPTFKDLAAKEGVSLMEFQKKAMKDPSIDKKFDALLKEEAAKGPCIATSWLSPWILDADARIYLFAPLEVRAARIASRDGMSLEEAKRHVRQRDAQNQKRYWRVYKIDILNTEHFDLCLNSGVFKPEQMADIAYSMLKQKGIKI